MIGFLVSIVVVGLIVLTLLAAALNGMSDRRY